jgi:hypothetical protein
LPTSKQTHQLQLDEQILAGIAKDLSSVAALYLGGTTYTPGSLSALVQNRIDAVNQVVTTRANWLAAVANYKAIDSQAKPVVRDLRAWLQAAFGSASPLLADFGFSPFTRPVKTPKKARRKAKKEKEVSAARER